jgi:hypothetical protein
MNTDLSTLKMPLSVRIGLLVLLAAYGVYNVLYPDHFGLLDHVDLAIHEAGHLVFAPFGEYMGFLGGTIFQLVVPLTFCGYFAYRGDRFGASVVLWWVAQNFWNIAPYVKDARAQMLPLVGGGVHDWEYILSQWGWLQYDQDVGQAVFAFGVLLFSMSIMIGVMNLRAPEPVPQPVEAPGPLRLR